ncbi:DNA polymerase-like [Vicia villosa]|uniref:DNA polymerase-like n=1 Tax=Vicia villosa TaxID=3911 RepID=UPI00273B1173|nr:DNA polymerase-like [Vicia villosa]
MIKEEQNPYTEVHVPYAIGFLLVRPGNDICYNMIETYFSESYITHKDIHERSKKMLSYFIERLVVVVRQNKSVKSVYFHNFYKFDGIMILKHLVVNAKKYTIKPLMRNNRLYEVAVFNDNKLIFNLRDSLTLLPGSLKDLAQNLCPHLGIKGSINHDDIKLDNLSSLKYQLIKYLKQDIILLGGIILKAQDILWNTYQIDILNNLTLSSLALAIFRTNYYDPNIWPIYIPNINEDTFIRRGYYGGRADVYMPKGNNILYYDVNSLYPFIMKSFSMPTGNPNLKS